MFNGVDGAQTTRRLNRATSWRIFRALAADGRFVERYVHSTMLK